MFLIGEHPLFFYVTKQEKLDQFPPFAILIVQFFGRCSICIIHKRFGCRIPFYGPF